MTTSATTRPILLAWSGGKDCLLALQRLLADPQWQVVGLLTTVNRNYQRVAMHGVRRDILLAQTAALGLPLIEVLLDWPGSNEAYEQAQAQALVEARMRWPGIRHCAFGDLFLEDVRDYRVRQLGRENWRAVFPLWGEDFDAALLDALPAGVDPCGERGEFHTLSHAGPLFRQPLALRRGESVLRDGRFQFTDFILDQGTPDEGRPGHGGRHDVAQD
jgi:diphthamide synthase (EF-2-diphthine--ammonia ligase)